MEIKGRTRFKAPIDEETFLDISSTCFDQESRSSMTSPNDLVWSTLLIFSPSISISISSLWVSNLCLDPIIISSVFATFRLRLFAFSLRLRLLSSGFISNFSSVNVFAVKLILVSSANILEEAFCRQLGKSLVYIKNSKGPSILPWGTPCWRKPVQTSAGARARCPNLCSGTNKRLWVRLVLVPGHQVWTRPSTIFFPIQIACRTGVIFFAFYRRARRRVQSSPHSALASCFVLAFALFCTRFLFLLLKSVSTANFKLQFERSQSWTVRRNEFTGIHIIKL